MDRESISKKIKDITKEFGDNDPPIYLLFGDLKDEEMIIIPSSKSKYVIIYKRRRIW